VALTRTPENAGENHNISFEAPFTLTLVSHIDMLFFQYICCNLWLLRIVQVNVVSCQVTHYPVKYYFLVSMNTL